MSAARWWLAAGFSASLAAAQSPPPPPGAEAPAPGAAEGVVPAGEAPEPAPAAPSMAPAAPEPAPVSPEPSPEQRAAPAPAAPGPAAERPAVVAPLPPAEPPAWQLWIGMRTSFIKDSGFDPFSTDDTFAGGGLGASWAFSLREAWSLGWTLAYEGGGAAGTARGASTLLNTHRLTSGPELRYHVLPRLYVFARPSVGAQYQAASLEEGSTGVTLEATAWRFAFDGSAGAALAALDLRGPRVPLMFWVVADGGYGITQRMSLSLKPPEDSRAPARTSALELGQLSASGPFFRFAIAGTF